MAVVSLGRLIVRAASSAAVAAAGHAAYNARIVRVPPEKPDRCPEAVSILLPLRDEASRVAPALRSLLEQQGLDDVEILVLDDCSTDGTAEVVRQVAGEDPRVAVFTGVEPPDRVLGKPHACHQLAERARGSVLVCVDADVVLAPHAVAAAVSLLREARLDAVSPFPRQRADGAGARLVQPLLQWSWLVLLPLRQAERSPRPSLTAANGQFFLIDAAMLRECGGFLAVGHEVLDDIALMRAVKRAGGRGVVADGSGVAECHMYETWPQLRDGYAKSLWSATGSAPGAVAISAALLGIWVLPAVAALTGSRAGLVGYAAGVAGRVVTARRTRGRVWPDSLAHPVSILTLVGLIARSWWARKNGRIAWKNRALRQKETG
ncbi:glycosyltransferase [Amycolatopsis sp. cmx-11-51]|uniref:glycosyltransferase n=1 Tax=Amycolatopsis sp. cmx-11-51 TaxID=2785797 RepID=UPI0039E56E09